MLLSVAVWSGNAADITPEQRDFFHRFSTLIALPAAAYAGRPFSIRRFAPVRHYDDLEGAAVAGAEGLRG